jgi:serine/threonine protein kinase
MSEPEPKRNVLFYLAAEGVIPVLGGCAGALVGGPVGGVAGVAVGTVIEKAINLFGKGIVERWQAWFARHKSEAPAAVAELAALPPAEARQVAASLLHELAPHADPQDVSIALEFLSAIPRSVGRALVPNPDGPGLSFPPTVALDDPRSLLQLLPADVPPYPVPADLPGTPYRLVELIGSGGFGAVYRAFSPTLQHLPLAVKFCLDRSLLPALNQERSNLERLMRAGGRGSDHVVRLYGYDLDHPTPFLVYEYVAGGDLTHLLAARVAALGQPPSAAEVFGWIRQIVEGLAFAHRTGLVHRDLKPANVLVELASGVREPPVHPEPGGSRTPLAGAALKLADFGLGGVAAARAARSRLGPSTIDYLSLAEQASLFRGAGTPLYMSPEQRRGAGPDPRHDLYALGVVWYQLLVGDVSRELHPGWAKELTVRFGVPQSHVALIERCVGWLDERPKDSSELLGLLHELPGGPPVVASPAEPRPAVTAAAPDTTGPLSGRQRGLASVLSRLDAAYTKLAAAERQGFGVTLLFGLALGGGATLLLASISDVEGPAIWLGVVVCFLYVWLMRSGVNVRSLAARRQVDEAIEDAATDFREELTKLGGRAVLRHPATVRQILAELTPAAARTLPAEGPTPRPVLPDPITPTAKPPGLGSPAADTAVDRSAPTPRPAQPMSEGRRRGLTASVARLEATYAELRDMGRWRFEITAAYGMLIALPLGFVLGFIVSVIWKDDRSGFLTGLIATILGWGIYVYLIRSGVKAVAEDVQKRADGQVEELVSDYAAEVTEWGGRAVLRHPPTVRQIATELKPTAAPTPPAAERSLLPLAELLTPDPPAPPAAPAAPLAFESPPMPAPPAAPDAPFIPTRGMVANSTAGIGLGWIEPVKELLADTLRKAVFLNHLRALDDTLRTTTKTITDSRVMMVVFPLVIGGGGAVGIALPTALTGALAWWVSVPLGLACGGLVASIFLFAFRTVIRSQMAKQQTAVRAFVTAYPVLAEWFGGEESLPNPQFVHSIRLAVDDQPRPGFWARMFGEV